MTRKGIVLFLILTFAVSSGCSDINQPPGVSLPKIKSDIKLSKNLTHFSASAPKELLPNIERIYAPFRAYIYDRKWFLSVTISLVDEPRTRGGLYLEQRNNMKIEVPEIMFKNPIYKNEGALIMFHELSHGIKAVIERDASQEVTQSLTYAYTYLVEKSGFSISKNLNFTKHIEYNPYFRIFDESSYVPPFTYSPYGHPYTSHRELFTSALTIFRFFPDEFIRRFRMLTPTQQRSISFVGNTIIKAVLTYKKDEKILRFLIPKYDKVLRVLL